MEKKIERVPYISKWYKEEQKDKLLNFAFDEQNTGSDLDIDKFSLYDKNLYTYSTNTTNGLWTTGYSKPTVQLKFEHYLTQKDVDYLRELIHVIHGDIDGAEYTKSRAKLAHDGLCTLYNYLINSNGVRDKAQEKQLEELIEKSKPQKPYGTLGEHWKELMELFRIKVQLIDEWKSQFAIVINNLKNGRQAVDRLPSKLDDIYKKLGVEFIEDFVKACEKCED